MPKDSNCCRDTHNFREIGVGAENSRRLEGTGVMYQSARRLSGTEVTYTVSLGTADVSAIKAQLADDSWVAELDVDVDVAQEQAAAETEVPPPGHLRIDRRREQAD